MRHQAMLGFLKLIEEPLLPWQVVEVHHGKGMVAQPNQADSKLIQGQLWLYQDGDIGFLWLGSPSEM